MDPFPNFRFQFWTNCPDSRLQEVVTWANTLTTKRLVVLLGEMKRRRMVMVDKVVISRYEGSMRQSAVYQSAFFIPWIHRMWSSKPAETKRQGETIYAKKNSNRSHPIQNNPGTSCSSRKSQRRSWQRAGNVLTTRSKYIEQNFDLTIPKTEHNKLEVSHIQSNSPREWRTWVPQVNFSLTKASTTFHRGLSGRRVG